jgi:malonyl-CoA decarboxylase
VTLSPAPNFAGWLARQRAQPSPALAETDRAALAGLDRPDWWKDETTIDDMRDAIMRAAAT